MAVFRPRISETADKKTANNEGHLYMQTLLFVDSISAVSLICDKIFVLSVFADFSTIDPANSRFFLSKAKKFKFLKNLKLIFLTPFRSVIN
jgi:hypothetical protein